MDDIEQSLNPKPYTLNLEAPHHKDYKDWEFEFWRGFGLGLRIGPFGGQWTYVIRLKVRGTEICHQTRIQGVFLCNSGSGCNPQTLL